LALANFNTFRLSASFRFPQDIANLATDILSWKNYLYELAPVAITGKGTDTKGVSKATIARTNLGLLLKAIEYITDNRKVRHIYFEGNINSYTYADDGASLYDVLNLYNNDSDRIRDKLIKSMKDLDELEEYIEKTEDIQLAMMSEIVKEYGNEIYGIIKSLKDLHTGDEDRDKAEMIFSTVHRAKGMEYDSVFLVNDFVTEEKLEKLKAGQGDKEEPLNITKWNEEINLLYVAVTRTKNKLHIPDTLIPKGFPAVPYIYADKGKKDATVANKAGKQTSGMKLKEKTYTVAEKRELNKDAYQPWTPELDKTLKGMVDSGASIGKMAERFGRTKGAIYSRLKKLDYFSDAN
jgi:F-box protein 18 (helicase)